MSKSRVRNTNTAAGGDGDLYGVAAGLTHALEVERLVRRRRLLAALDLARRRVDGHSDRRRPVGAHLSVLVVETLELQLQVRSAET